MEMGLPILTFRRNHGLKVRYWFSVWFLNVGLCADERPTNSYITTATGAKEDPHVDCRELDASYNSPRRWEEGT